MGYEVRRVVRLEFDDPDGSSAFVRLRSLTNDEFRGYTDDADERSKTPTGDVLAQYLVEWNFELDGEPVPASAEGISSLDPALMNLVFREWIKALRLVPHPLVPRSDAGQQSDPPPMTMDDL